MREGHSLVTDFPGLLAHQEKIGPTASKPGRRRI